MIIVWAGYVQHFGKAVRHVAVCVVTKLHEA
jgi:hypothetical protein